MQQKVRRRQKHKSAIGPQQQTDDKKDGDGGRGRGRGTGGGGARVNGENEQLLGTTANRDYRWKCSNDTLEKIFRAS